MSSVYYLTPSSFCFGVKRSIEELIKIIDKHPNDKIFCIHALVHNPKITKFFADRGIIFVEDINEVTDKNSVVVFSAHGIDRKIFNQAFANFKAVYNLECPFVSKIYNEIQSFIGQGIKQFLYIGKEGHQEAKNVIDNIKYQGGIVHNIIKKEDIAMIPFAGKFAILSQTTLNFALVQELIKDVQSKFPESITPKVSDICKATYERQGVIKKYSANFDTLVVIGGKESSNTKELYEIGLKEGKTVFFGEGLEDLLEDQIFINQKQNDVAVTGGASTPIEDILAVLDWYQKKGYISKKLEFNDN